MSEKQRTKTSIFARRFDKVFLEEMDTLKAKVRAAYALEIRQKEGETLTEEELQLIKDQAINSDLIERLRSMRDNYRQNNTGKYLSDNSNQIILRFFYLVRLAQQGFFYLVSSIYPTIEYSAVAYLADKLITSSLHLHASTNPKLRGSQREIMYEIVENLSMELDEPVGEGFRTTYKQIMTAIHRLSYEGYRQPQNNNNTEEGESKVKNAPQAMPPIWVVMPYTSMMDNASFALPGAQPTLPFPTNMLPPGFAHPFAQQPQQRKKQGRNSNRRNDDDRSVKTQEEPLKEQNAVENAADQKVDEQKVDDQKVEEQKADGQKADDEKIENEKDEKEEEKQVEEKFEDDLLDDDDDRFADADSDYEYEFEDEDEEEDEEEEGEEKEKEEHREESVEGPKQEESATLVAETVETVETVAQVVEEPVSSTKEEASETKSSEDGWGTPDKEAAKSGWRDFVASSTNDDDDLLNRVTNSRLSPKIQLRNRDGGSLGVVPKKKNY